MSKQGPRLRGPWKLRLAVLAAVAATAAIFAGTASAAYWFYSGYLGDPAIYPQGRSVFADNVGTGTQYLRMTWNGHYTYGCLTTITSGGTWNSECLYTLDVDGDTTRTYSPSSYGKGGCRNPEPQGGYWANCHHDSTP